MATLKELKKRRTVVGKMKRMTSAIKMAAQAKMAKSRTRQKDALHHVQDVQTIMHHVVNDHDYARGKALHSPLQSTTMNDRAPWLVIVFSSDRGLCGTFNSQIQHRANACITGLTKANHTVQVACIGSVTLAEHDTFIDMPWSTFDTFASDPHDLAPRIMDDFVHGRIQGVHIVHQKFINVLKQEAVATQLLPLVVPPASHSHPCPGVLSYEPSPHIVWNDLCRAYGAALLNAIIVDHQLSEHAARFLAMDSASDNARTMGDKLATQYNRLRQTKITTEILELAASSHS